LNPVRRHQRLSGSVSQEHEGDVRKHAFRPPRFRKSYRNRCSEREEDNVDNYDEDDEDREESSAVAKNSTDFGKSTAAIVSQGIQPFNDVGGTGNIGETSTQKTSGTLLPCNSGFTPTDGHPPTMDLINSRIDNLSRFSNYFIMTISFIFTAKSS
jgi:hypothetical protein